MNSSTKTCPYCAEEVQDEAIICKHCKKDLTTKDAKARFIRKLAEEKQKKLQEEREKEAKRKQEEKEKYIASLSGKEKEAYFAEEKRKENVTTLWAVVVISFLIGLSTSPLFGLFIPLIGIWLHPNKGEAVFINRFKDYKKYVFRLILSSMVAFIIVLVPILRVQAEKARIQAEEEAQIAEEFPEPSIEIISNLDKQGDASSYLLEFTATDTDTVSVSDQYGTEQYEVNNSDGVYSVLLSLDSTKNTFEILATNKYKEDSLEFTIERNETEEEQAERIAEEEEKAAEQAEIEAKQLEWERSEAGQICSQHPAWSSTECEKLADNKIWIGMTIDMLKYNRGLPNSANPSDYGSGIQWQWCWYNYTPMCFYDYDNDGVIDSYN